MALRASPIASFLVLAALVPAARAQLTVGAAAELRPVIEEASRLYTERTGNPLRVVYASPSKLVELAAKKGIDGLIAPMEYLDSARAKGLAGESSILIASSPITAWSRQGKALPDSQLSFLLDTAIHGIAASDPTQSPDGVAVMPFLQLLRADSQFLAKLRIAPEPSAAIDSISAGRADAALLPQSAFWSSPVGGLGRQMLLDSMRISPQRTGCLVLTVAPERQANATAFFTWLRGPQAKGFWRRKGFLLP
jgi:ABC-type molybdate transport system substrate-binding protein